MPTSTNMPSEPMKLVIAIPTSQSIERPVRTTWIARATSIRKIAILMGEKISKRSS